MASAYPSALDALPTSRVDGTDTIAASDHNDAADAINKIEVELGTDPAGLYAATVRERFEISAYKNQSCKFATTATLAATYANGTAGVGATLTANPAAAAPTTDGQTWVVGDRVLVKNQTAPAQNGLYVVTQITSPWILTRAIDADTPAKLADSKVLVDQGTTNADTEWLQASTAPTIGTTSIYFRRTTPFYGVGNPRSPWVPGFSATGAPSIYETIPRQLATGTLSTTSNGSNQYLIGGITVHAGRTVTNINCVFTNASSGPTVNWFALARQSDRLVMAHTANTTTATTANALHTRALTAAWTPIEDTPVWVIFSQANTTTGPIMLSTPAGQTAANLIAPAIMATNGVTPSSTVPTDNTTVINAATTGVASLPYVFLT